ncbi:MAG: MerR family transcriptional regulator [Armatimonadota bacterium]|nr:MerR family transcriptional regulator [Armatimonadota bacterium]
MTLSKENAYPIKIAARRTGLSAHVIRIWERRYGAVSPTRTPTDRRLYSEEDIERLQLLKDATLEGHSISQIAAQSTETLRELVTRDRKDVPEITKSPERDVEPLHGSYLDKCMKAIDTLDAEGLEQTMAQAAVALGETTMMEHVITPLMYKIGEYWRQGALRVAQEHLAAATSRTFLGCLLRAADPGSSAPNLVVTTLPGQLHELGALMAATTAASEGWRVTYLGPSLPAEEIAGAAIKSDARAVALSLVYPAGDSRVEDELRRLKSYLPAGMELIAGGRSATDYADILEAIGASLLPDLLSFRLKLEQLRTRR